MFYRRKVILSLLEEFGEKISRTEMQKLLLIFSMNQTKKCFDFVPYKYGCFSFCANHDLVTLESQNLIKTVESNNREFWQLNSTESFKNLLKDGDKVILEDIKLKFGSYSATSLIRYTYLNYPYFAINSEIAGKILDENELARVRLLGPSFSSKALFSIGYEGISFDHYLNSLIKNGVEVLCDVRKNPFSMKYGFSRRQLEPACQKLGIEYIHYPKLGIVSDKRKKLTSQNDYDRLFNEYEKTTLLENHKYVEEISALFLNYKRIALTCFEHKVCMCHRSKIVDALSNLQGWDIPIKHL